MTARIIDGAAIAERLIAETTRSATGLTRRRGHPPGLGIVLVGDDPASQVYVRSKVRRCGAAGFHADLRRLPADAAEAQVIAAVDALDADARVDGILVQLPLPPQVRPQAVLDRLDPAKDVDGLTAISQGRLAAGVAGLRPCTPQGCVRLARETIGDLTGARVVILGRSLLVGRPAAQLFLLEDCTVTLAHSKSRDVAELCREADILIAAVGRAGLVRGDWIRPGATVLDVGMNRSAQGNLLGDVAFDEALAVAGAITPVPGGVGKMTIAELLANTLAAAARHTP